MHFLLDESADNRFIDHLERLGHDVKTVTRDFMPSIDDVEVLTHAYEEQRILITMDKDFGELVVRRRLSHTGVILFRIKTVDIGTMTRLLDYVLDNFPDQLHHLLVVTERGVRVRHFSQP